MLVKLAPAAEAGELQRIARRRAVADEVHDGVAVGLPGMEHEGVVAGVAGEHVGAALPSSVLLPELPKMLLASALPVPLRLVPPCSTSVSMFAGSV